MIKYSIYAAIAAIVYGCLVAFVVFLCLPNQAYITVDEVFKNRSYIRMYKNANKRL